MDVNGREQARRITALLLAVTVLCCSCLWLQGLVGHIYTFTNSLAETLFYQPLYMVRK
jgi:peptidoglycan/LPS O-acetylase OafA/YrhL